MKRVLSATAMVTVAISLAACPLQRDQPSEVTFPVDREAGEVAFRFEGQGDAALIVPVYVNDQGPFDFVLDTGATYSCIEQELAAQLELPERSAAAIGATPTGGGQIQIVQVDSLRVGGATAEGLDVCVLDLAHMEAIGVTIEGLLGLNFLRAFHVALDFERNVVTFGESRPASE